MSLSLTILGCSHEPKVIKKIGIWQNNPCEILVCGKCRQDPDLQNFREDKL